MIKIIITLSLISLFASSASAMANEHPDYEHDCSHHINTKLDELNNEEHELTSGAKSSDNKKPMIVVSKTTLLENDLSRNNKDAAHTKINLKSTKNSKKINR